MNIVIKYTLLYFLSGILILMDIVIKYTSLYLLSGMLKLMLILNIVIKYK